ncbi:MAG: cyclic nucleotide-binding domain-containing protein [Chromatiales bacterium]|jgi:CRP-like cAMP-binding protein|nr:cyclic nucleotide-binding domain-containing protein [Chromatiales bacterium]
MADLGRLYKDGEIIVREGDSGDCMYVVQKGRVDVVTQSGNREIVLRSLARNDFFGEMALFERDLRTSTARAVGEARILTVDRRTFLRGISEDPSLALRMVRIMSHRIKDLTARLTAYENTPQTGST